VATYRKTNQWQAQSRDMMENFKRYYHNSFLDSQRQEAYNLFLGYYKYAQGQPMLWDLHTDYYLHHEDPRLWSSKKRRNYINWYTPAFLNTRTLPDLDTPELEDEVSEKGIESFDDYWLEYYRPLAISSFLKIFSFKINSNTKYHPSHINLSTGVYDLSPFKPRIQPPDPDAAESHRKPARKGVTIVDPNSESDGLARSINAETLSLRGATAGSDSPLKQSILRDTTSYPYPAHDDTNNLTFQSSLVWQNDTQGTLARSNSLTTSTLWGSSGTTERTKVSSHWTHNQFFHNSLNPSVTTQEEQEYEAYINHPLNVPLVISNDTLTEDDLENINPDFIDYVSKAQGGNILDPDVIQINIEEDDAWNADMGKREVVYGGVAEHDVEAFKEFLKIEDEPLKVREGETEGKRYKAYRQWLRGKSLFKVGKIDPELSR
jgi:phosphatidylinositol 3,5-bisphosphate 5-phosphatase